MSKIATISCIILAVSINLEGTQASLLGNRLNPLNGLLDKLPTLDNLEDTIADIGKDVSNLGANIDADLTNELNLNDGVIKQASIFTCAKLVKEASQTINGLGSIVLNCVTQELKVVDNYFQSINKSVNDLITTIQNKIQQSLQEPGNVFDKIKKLMDDLPGLIEPKVKGIISTVQELFSTVPKDLNKCWNESPNGQKDYDNLVKDIQDCVKSVPLLG